MNAQPLGAKVSNFALVLRDQGVSYQASTLVQLFIGGR
jgi:hypothetical protein